MKKIARFEKVSFDQFKEGWLDSFNNDEAISTEELIESLTNIYENIILPKRATRGSAGYDFFSPLDFTLKPGESIKIPTGIKAWMEEGWVLQCYPRSGLGFKYRLQLNNTVGIIDSDYYYSDNEGHIFCKLTNGSREEKTLTVETGSGFMQGIFMEYGITVDDTTEELRNGGMGSTNRRG